MKKQMGFVSPLLGSDSAAASVASGLGDPEEHGGAGAFRCRPEIEVEDIILTVSGGYQSQNMWCFPFSPPLRG